MRFFSYSVIAIVIAIIVAGLFMVGSPAEERLRQHDQQRVWDLQSMQAQVVSYWQSKDELPPLLDVLNNDLLGFRVPMDPATGDAYEYMITGDLSFTLCATFALASESEDTRVHYPVSLDNTWEHEAGRTCFDRTIDPDIFSVPDSPKPISVPAR